MEESLEDTVDPMPPGSDTLDPFCCRPKTDGPLSRSLERDLTVSSAPMFDMTAFPLPLSSLLGESSEVPGRTRPKLIARARLVTLCPRLLNPVIMGLSVLNLGSDGPASVS